ncbi:MAG TPA: DUF3592 domain-containing protein [Flavobacteriales bacterium]|nr:DUF3592 domain-containing protein [Flavobacteriales bacterium]
MAVVVLIFSLLIALVCFWASVRLLLVNAKVKKWRRVQATVVMRELALRAGPGRRSTYVLDVMYKYRVGGEEYSGKNVHLVNLVNGWVYYTSNNGNKKLWEIDDKPLIYVNPKNPARSVIYRSGVGFYYFIFLMGLLSLAVGLVNYFVVQ